MKIRDETRAGVISGIIVLEVYSLEIKFKNIFCCLWNLVFQGMTATCSGFSVLDEILVRIKINKIMAHLVHHL